MNLQQQMEQQLVGKDFWHPDASRVGAEQLMQNGKYGCFIIRRSSNPGCLALSHKQSDGTFGHALIQYNGSGYSLEQTTQVYDTIEGLIKSLDLRLEDVKKNKPRPAQVFGQPVLLQVEAITNYNAQSAEELTMGRGDIINVIAQQVGWYVGELDGRQGKFPAGLTKKVPGSDIAPAGNGSGGMALPMMGGPVARTGAPPGGFAAPARSMGGGFPPPGGAGFGVPAGPPMGGGGGGGYPQPGGYGGGPPPGGFGAGAGFGGAGGGMGGYGNPPPGSYPQQAGGFPAGGGGGGGGGGFGQMQPGFNGGGGGGGFPPRGGVAMMPGLPPPQRGGYAPPGRW